MADHLVIPVFSDGSPLLEWHCPKCRTRRPFESSEKFRANCNGKLVDIWLIYRCIDCETTKNLTVVTRTPVSRIPADLMAAAESNDTATARRFARDLAVIGTNRVRLWREERWRLDPPRPGPLERPCPTTVTIEFVEPLLLRLQSPLAHALGVSKSHLERLLLTGHVTFTNPVSLRRVALWSQPVALQVVPTGEGPSALSGTVVSAERHDQSRGG